MSGFNPSQVSFAGGEISPKLHGRVDSELYRIAVKTSQEFLHPSHGSALMRAGSRRVGTIPDSEVPRIIPFNVSAGEPFGLVLVAGKMTIRDYLGALVTIPANLAPNGTFDAGSAGWTLGGVGGTATWQPGGFIRCLRLNLENLYLMGVAWAAATTYTIRFRARGIGTCRVAVVANNVIIQTTDVTLTPQWQTFSVSTTPGAAGGTPSQNSLAFYPPSGTTTEYCDVDDVFLSANGATPANYITTPWVSVDLRLLQADQDLTKNRMVIVGGTGGPQLLTRNVHGFFEFKAVPFITPPASWGGSNWPTIIDWGYQGRLWLGSTGDEPNTVWGSKSGLPFDFGQVGGTPVASDGWSFNASVRGALRWLQGQKTLLMGAERVEQAASGGGAVMWTANVNVEEESAYGSAPVQAANIGDRVAFVTRDRKEIRVLSYDNQTKAGWVSQAITYLAEHLFQYLIGRVHYAPGSEPMLVVETNYSIRGSLVFATYDASAKAIAWSTVHVGAPVVAAAILETLNGPELWLAVTRSGGMSTPELEIMPLHRTGLVYLDSYLTGLVAESATITGLNHLASQTVRIIIDGQLYPDQVVTVGGTVTVDPELAGLTYFIGLPYTARLVQLPLEGGLQTGSSQSAKRRRTKIRLRLNNSALPMVNGQRPPERFPADPMDTPTDLLTGDVDVNVLGWEEDGAITIEQDLPFRTEVLAIFGNAQVNEV